MSETPDFLQQMARSSRARVARARAQRSEAQLQRQARDTAAPPPLQLSAEGFDLIAEVKLRSPASGRLQSGAADVDQRVERYATAGAAAISVLTEPERFDGELEHLTQASRILAGRRPVMRKDFLVDAYQVYEARLAGASGVLLIVRLLPRTQQQALLEVCAELGLFALLEAFDAHDLQQAAQLVARYRTDVRLLVGVNCRDLASLQVQPQRLESLAPLLPVGVPHVAESGLEDGADAARLVAAGYDMALVGSALMRSADPAALVRELLSAGRAAAAQVRIACGSKSAG